MNFKFVTQVLLFCLFCLSANNALACHSDNSDLATNTQDYSKKSCCSPNEVQTPCGNDSLGQHSEHPCPCDHNNEGCHCPGCGIVFHSSAAFSPIMPFVYSSGFLLNDLVHKQAFYFADHLPEDVYFPIWQPPKRSA